ncbi:MAG: ABC transporter permease, partial [Acidobacteriaceae bacterium]|nr:ABC transporter permease [Acidobacteriaceae bacterium]
MNVLSYLRCLAGKFLRSSQTQEDVEEELQCHIQYRADDLERGGLDRAEAERRARIEFGGHARFREECRDALGARLLDTVFHDVRFSLRLLRKSPGFTIAAVLTLALAIGANAVVFGVLNGLVLRPLNVPQPESLWGTEYGSDPGWQSYPNYVDLRDRNRSFEDLAAFNFAFVGLDAGHDPVRASGYAVSGNYFDVLRIHPYLGRFFHRSDERGPNSVPCIVLSHPYWHSHFQDDRGVVGRVVLLNKHPYTVIGVAPPEFRGTLMFASVDFFMPLVDQEQVDGVSLNSRGNIHAIFEVLGHLKPGVTPAQAIADMNAVGADLARTYPKEFAQKTSSLSREGLTSFGAPVKAFVGALMLLSCLILLAACANLGSLFAARAADRSREVALRIALGSTRNRVLRGLFTEAVLISLMGGALGLWASVMLLGKLSVWQPFPTAPIRIPVNPDTRVYVVALLLALISGFLFGVVPVRQVLRTDPYEIIKASSITPGKRRITIRDLLLTLQIAICGVLVTSSMVAVRGLARSLYSSLGFEARNATIVDLSLAMAGYSNDQAPALQKRILDSLRTIPGVESIGLSSSYPPLIYAAAVRENVFRNETNDLTVANVAVRPYRYDISPGYFEAAKTSLLTGRDFTWHDDKTAPAVAVVNRGFAVRLFGSVNAALGGFYKLQDGTRVQVVGIVEDGKYMSLTEGQQ